MSRPSSQALPIGDGRYVVPGNRWDLLEGLEPAAPVHVSVIVPYYDNQPQLDRLMAALGLLDHPDEAFEIIIADDGSPEPPQLPTRLPGRAVPVRLFRQADRGFGAAAARNLGAVNATGQVLAFLDQDTVPEPSYLRHVSRLPALLPDAIVTARRRHAELDGWSPGQVRAWLSGSGPAPAELAEPAWLIQEYQRSGDLLDEHDLSHRFLISAVLACSADLFARIGGFDESFSRYGGEDWDLAHRAHTAGAVLAHVRAAVAWHDGPDWAGRGGEASRRMDKQNESTELARRIPVRRRPASSGDSAASPGPVGPAGRAHPPDVMVVPTEQSQLPATSLAGLAGGTRRAVRVHEPEPGQEEADAGLLARSRYLIELSGTLSADELDRVLEPLENDRLGRVRVIRAAEGSEPVAVAVAYSRRALSRVRRWENDLESSVRQGPADLIGQLFGECTVYLAGPTS